MSVMRVFCLKPGDTFLQTEHSLAMAPLAPIACRPTPGTLGLYASHLEPGVLGRTSQPLGKQASLGDMLGLARLEGQKAQSKGGLDHGFLDPWLMTSGWNCTWSCG